MSEELFGRQLVDSAEEDQATDYVPSVSLDDPDGKTTASEERRLSAFLRRAEALAGPENDAKIKEAVATVSGLLDEGYHPIVYCRFIQTAYYVADQLRNQLQSRHTGLRVSAVTGNDGDGEQRKELVLDLAEHSTRVLVATDCLSEGVNLQEHYDAVIHYDLPWNPNRLEQREGRVDRFGQSKPTIKTVLLYGADNEVDLVVLDVLLRKAQTIRQRLGITVPVPVEAEQVVNTLVNSVLLRGRNQGLQATLPLQATHTALRAGRYRQHPLERREVSDVVQHGVNHGVDAARTGYEVDGRGGPVVALVNLPGAGEPGSVRHIARVVVESFGLPHGVGLRSWEWSFGLRSKRFSNMVICWKGGPLMLSSPSERGMNVFLDLGFATLSFALGTAVVLSAWLGLFPVHSAVLFFGFSAMVVGGLILTDEYFLGPDR